MTNVVAGVVYKKTAKLAKLLRFKLFLYLLELKQKLYIKQPCTLIKKNIANLLKCSQQRRISK